MVNLLELGAIVHNKETAILFFQQHGIIHQNRMCSNNHAMTLSVGDRDRWRCHIRGCREQIGIRQGTWLQGSKLPFRKIILFIYCWAREYSSISFCEKELEIDDNTVIDYNMYLREVCANTLLLNPIRIGEPGTTVEIDESQFARRKNNVGRILPTQWVFGGVCRETRECFMFAVEDRTAATLLPIIQDCIRPGTTIVSDLWRAYHGIANLPAGFNHLTVNHSIHFVDPVTGANTQTVESTWNSAKRRNRKHHGTSRKMLDSYLCEFLWRRRLGNADAFEAILADIVIFWPPV